MPGETAAARSAASFRAVGSPGQGPVGGAGRSPGSTTIAVERSLAEGYDADIALVDPDRTWTVRAADSESAQEYTPFEGFELTAAVTDTFLRGQHVLEAGKVVGDPQGQYLRRS
ncbi:hypothetical protein GCM10009557_77720 [Virgisporangium ochraceum]|uniref:Dihydroorotase n=1 Tax=Virgisporangium ochraceum TaxID=65505 RepID=A0A8J4A1M3_9ACTN|nr:hypothetical protein [Virgisporangium ochraceum]GIJ73561.1 hypothetical protein Voc01_084780 [Virgisporangium ochraceum]